MTTVVIIADQWPQWTVTSFTRPSRLQWFAVYAVILRFWVLNTISRLYHGHVTAQSAFSSSTTRTCYYSNACPSATPYSRCPH